MHAGLSRVLSSVAVSQETGVEVVPIVSHTEHGAKRIMVAAGDPMSFDGKSKNEAMDELRDALATLSTVILPMQSCYPDMNPQMRHGKHIRKCIIH